MNSKFPRDEMKVELPSKDAEVQYALILSQMIEVAEEDPSQLRLAIYEFARTKLTNNSLNATEAEKERLSKALESAIAGVEKFAKMRGERRSRIVFRHGDAELSDASRADDIPSLPTVDVATQTPLFPLESPAKRFTAKGVVRVREMLHRAERLNWFAMGLSCFVAIIILFVITQGSSLWRNDKRLQATSISTSTVEAGATASPLAPQLPAAAQRSQADLTLPIPDTYGVYLLNGEALTELEALETRVPDRRIEMSTPVSVVHQTTIADGAPRFLIYRRDLANDPPDKLEVRPLARVARIISFDSKGKPVFSATASTWIIRNIVFEFRMRPVPGRPEMLLAQAKDDAAALPSGRYVLTLKDKGFDFVVAGETTDPAQCVEQTDAVNGSFYSDCQFR